MKKSQLDLFSGVEIEKIAKKSYKYAVHHYTREDFYYECEATDANEAVRKCSSEYGYWDTFREARSLLTAKRVQQPALKSMA